MKHLGKRQYHLKLIYTFTRISLKHQCFKTAVAKMRNVKRNAKRNEKRNGEENRQSYIACIINLIKVSELLYLMGH